MALHIFPQGRIDFLNRLLGNGQTAQENLVLHLYFNHHIPVDGDTLSMYVEPNFQGYSPQVLTATSWPNGTTSGGNLSAQSSYPTVTWTVTQTGSEPNSAWGYFVTGQTSGHLLFAELFPAALGTFGAGDAVSVTPFLTFGSQF